MASEQRLFVDPKLRRDGRRAVRNARLGTRVGALGWLLAGCTTVIALVAALAVIMRPSGGQRISLGPEPDIHGAPATVAAGGYSTPPWPAPADATAAVHAAGLPMLGREGNVEHIHAHLDVLIDGQAVVVPADIGIDSRRHMISPLHTHDDSGVIHIESPVARQFSLGELFSEWLVSLSESNIGALHAGEGKVVRVFVNGTQTSGNPRAIILKAHDEIAVLYAKPRTDEAIPSHYAFQGDM